MSIELVAVAGWVVAILAVGYWCNNWCDKVYAKRAREDAMRRNEVLRRRIANLEKQLDGEVPKIYGRAELVDIPRKGQMKMIITWTRPETLGERINLAEYDGKRVVVREDVAWDVTR